MEILTIERYWEHPNVEFRGNPLIEFVPWIGRDHMAVLLTCSITFEADERDHEADLRLQYIARCKDFFFPQPAHSHIAWMAWNAVLRSYVGRSPVRRTAKQKFDELCRNLDSSTCRPSPNIKEASQTLIVWMGTAGTGKGRTFDVLFSRLPSTLLFHPKYKAYQLLSITVTSPGNGRDPKALFWAIYIRLFEVAVSAELPVPRHSYHAPAWAIRSAAIKLARLLNLGLLIIDEVQHLLTGTAAADGASMKALTDLVNEFPAPVLAIGTWQAVALTQLEFRLTRRSVSLESAASFKIKKGKQFDIFIEALFSVQFLSQHTEPSREIIDCFYQHTQGVEDFIVKLYMLVQMEAILDESEAISVELIQYTANLHFSLVATPIRMMRDGIKENDPALFDIEPEALDEYLVQQFARAEVLIRGKGRERGTAAKVEKKVALIRGLVAANLASEGAAATIAENVVERLPTRSTAEHFREVLRPAAKSPRITRSTRLTVKHDKYFEELEEGDLRKIAYFAVRSGQSVPSALRSERALVSVKDIMSA